jgi:hypothetical protein
VISATVKLCSNRLYIFHYVFTSEYYKQLAVIPMNITVTIVSTQLAVLPVNTVSQDTDTDVALPYYFGAVDMVA